MSRVWKQLVIPVTLAVMPHFVAGESLAADKKADKKSQPAATSKQPAAAAPAAAPKAPAPSPLNDAVADSSGKTSISTGPNACVTAKAEEELNACPAGPAFTGRPKEPSITFHGKVEDIKKGDKEIKVGVPTDQQMAGYRDSRKTRLQQKAKALLAQEIKETEDLMKLTEVTSKDRPGLLRRLAEDYVEFENSAFKEKTEAEIARDELRKTNPTEASKKEAIVQSRGAALKAARNAAIKNYKLLLEDYSGTPSPRFKTAAPVAPLLDEIYYYLAYEYEQSQDWDNARKIYAELIAKVPNSKYVSSAYLAFGDLYFNEAMGDPSKWNLALQAYQRVISKPPPENKAYGYAWYKLAYVFVQTNQLPLAIDAFKKTIDYATQYAQQDPGASKLAENARKDIIPVYAQALPPEGAYNLFKSISGDTGGQNTKALKMEDDLGQNYYDTGHYPEVIKVYRDLLSRNSTSDNTCEYQSRITEAVTASHSSDKKLIDEELDRQLKRMLSFKNENHTPEAKQTCANRTAAMITENAMAWNIEAVGTGGQRGTNDPKTMDAAAKLYQKVVDTWTTAEYAKFEFPRLVKEDWPTIPKLKYLMADLLYYRQRWADCGPAFDKVVAEDPTGANASEAAYAAALCYENVYLNTHTKASDIKGSGNLPGGKDTKGEADEKYRAKEMTAPQKAMVDAFSRYACYVHPDEKDLDGQKQLVEVKFHRARAYYEAQQWEKAAAAFREIAFNYSTHDSAVYAAMLYLESINVLMFHAQPKRPTCVDNMTVDVPKIIELYCAGDKAAKNADSCGALAKVQCSILRLRAQHMVDEADKGPVNALDLYEQGGRAYLDIWEKYGAAAIDDNQPPQCEALDEIVYNGAKAYQAGRLMARAIKARGILLSSKYHMETSELAKKAIYEIGANYQAIQVYDKAAEYYERYAKENPNADKASKALSDAIVLRLGLGDEDAAMADVKSYQSHYGNSSPAQSARVAFSLGAHYADKEDWVSARRYLEASMSSFAKAGPDVRIQAHATLARALMKTKSEDKARGEYAAVLKLWGDGKEVQKEIDDTYKADAQSQRDRYLGKTLEAVGEALFVAAEERRQKEVQTLAFPIYKGAGNREDVLKYNKDKLMPWFAKKKAAIEAVDTEYKKVTELQPAPPKWVIAAASRAGLMWGEFFDEFGKAPTPKEWDRFPEVKAQYLQMLDAARMPLKDRSAKPALKRCLDQSVKYQYFDNFSRDCEKWLAKNYKNEYHVVDELHGAPTLSNAGIDDAEPPLTASGQLWHAKATGPATEKGTPDAAEEKKSNGKKAK